jgi:hypothetical protein
VAGWPRGQHRVDLRTGAPARRGSVISELVRFSADSWQSRPGYSGLSQLRRWSVDKITDLWARVKRSRSHLSDG